MDWIVFLVMGLGGKIFRCDFFLVTIFIFNFLFQERMFVSEGELKLQQATDEFNKTIIRAAEYEGE